MIDSILPDQMSYEAVADLFMSTMTGEYSGLTRAEFLAILRKKYPDQAALNAIVGAVRVEAQSMLDAGAFSPPASAGRGYALVADGKAIRCGACGCTSSNAGDVANLYCSMCKKFHAH